jgi:hypothetical protein
MAAGDSYARFMQKANRSKYLSDVVMQSVPLWKFQSGTDGLSLARDYRIQAASI